MSPRLRIIFNRELHYDILKSTVCCTREEVGCRWVDKLEQLGGHLKECPYVEEVCVHSCGLSVQRRQLEEHNTVCERLPVNCHQCGEVYERRDHSDHVTICPYTKVKCPFSIAGCTTEVLNKDLQEHFDESLAWHYSLVHKQSQEVRAEVEGSKLMADFKEAFNPQQRQVDAVNVDVLASEVEIDELEKAFEEAQREFEELKVKHNLLLQEKQSLAVERDKALLGIRKDSECALFEAKVRCYGPALPLVDPNDITSRPPDCPAITQEYMPRVVFTIPNFNVRRMNDELVCLPPFFSPSGYRMSLVVYCNGYGEGKVTHLSIFVSLLKGKYDEHLTWPLKCAVTVEVLSVNSKYCIQKIDVSSRHAVLEDECPSINGTYGGCLRFMSLALLANVASLYIIDGCLKIAVASVCTKN